MLSIQQLIKALKKLQNTTAAGGDLVKSIKHVAVSANNTNETNTSLPFGTIFTTSLHNHDKEESETSSIDASTLPEQQQQQTNSNYNKNCSNNSSSVYTSNNNSSQLCLEQKIQQSHFRNSHHNNCFSLCSSLNAESSNLQCDRETFEATTQDSFSNKLSVSYNTAICSTCSPQSTNNHLHIPHQQQPQRSQRIQNFYQQQIFHQFHTQHNQNSKQKQTQFAMSSLAAEPLTLQKSNGKKDAIENDSSSTSSSASCPDTKQQNSSTGKPCFNTGLADILQFMELIGNLKVNSKFICKRLKRSMCLHTRANIHTYINSVHKQL